MHLNNSSDILSKVAEILLENGPSLKYIHVQQSIAILLCADDLPCDDNLLDVLAFMYFEEMQQGFLVQQQISLNPSLSISVKRRNAFMCKVHIKKVCKLYLYFNFFTDPPQGYSISPQPQDLKWNSLYFWCIIWGISSDISLWMKGLSEIHQSPLDNSYVNLSKVSWGLLGPQRTLMAHIFVIGWIHSPVIFIIL